MRDWEGLLHIPKVFSNFPEEMMLRTGKYPDLEMSGLPRACEAQKKRAAELDQMCPAGGLEIKEPCRALVCQGGACSASWLGRFPGRAPCSHHSSSKGPP